MSLNTLVTGTQLNRWADELPARGLLPRLVRRLVLATTDAVEEISFAADEGIGRPGYDGVVRTPAGNSIVPSGWSGWEMGVNQDPRHKANDDYAARTKDPAPLDPRQTTFVFVTPRRWIRKTDWVAEKRSEQVWADVRAYDADDLEQWLERAPAVAAWACRLIHRLPDEGLRDLDEVWEGWACRTTPRLTPGLLLAGRAELANRVREWLSGPPAILTIRADSVDEAAGFVAALVETLPDPDRERSRAVVVDTPDAWRGVAGSRTPLVLVATGQVSTSPVQAVSYGHHVLLTYGADAAGVAADVVLPRLRRGELEGALVEMGVPQEQARVVAGESKGRVPAVVELLGGGVPAAPPRWADPTHGPQLVPLLLAGSWKESGPDRKAVQALARLSADDLDRLLARWANGVDPPVQRVGDVWEWVSRRRAWPHLARFVGGADLEALRRTVLAVLGELDPRHDMPPEDRWAAAVHGRLPSFSDRLREGLADGLALLAAGGDATHPGLCIDGFVNGVVRELFGAGPDPRRWYALAGVLCPLAEAAPDAFLAAVERDVIGDADVRTALFTEEGIFGSSRHTHLLWSLETLAWIPDYLCGAAVILAGLVTLDPGGHLANRPRESLRTIFLTWRPHTMASVAQRLAAIDAIYRRYPIVAFDLCLQLMPNGFDSVHPTPQPRWRAWVIGRENCMAKDREEAVNGVFDRALRWAGEDQNSWARLLKPIPQVGLNRRGHLLAELETLPLESFAEQANDTLRRAVRRILHQKRTMPGIYPELSQDHVNRLESIYARLQPADLTRRHGWLFDRHPDLLTVTGDDWNAQEEARASERAAAIREMLQVHGPCVVLRLAESVEAPWGVGFHVGLSDLPDAAVVGLLSNSLRSEVGSHLPCFQGIVRGRFQKQGWSWVERVFATEAIQGWPAAHHAQFALALPFETLTWDWAEGLGTDAAAEYWRLTPPYGFADAARDAPRAIRTLLERSRPFAALQIANRFVMGHRERSAVTPDLLLAVLRGVTSAATGDVQAAETPEQGDGLGYCLGELLTAVEEESVADESELARFEWIWLTVLEHTRRGLRVLPRMLATNPSLFAMTVGLIHRPRIAAGENEPPPPDEATRRRAVLAVRLLHEWRGLPGQTGAGALDEGLLREWVIAARDALRASGHAEFGDHCIGEVLARSPVDADGVWPHECARNLLEELMSEGVEEGIHLGVVNGRGTVMRRQDTGGDPERSLADRYDSWASTVASAAPRTARVLREISAHYRADARWHDNRRDLDEYLR